MKKILFIPGIVKQTVGGAELQMSFFAKELAKLNYDIYGIQLNLPDGIEALYKNLFLTNSNVGKKIKSRSFFLKKVYDYISEIQPDIIYQRGELPYMAVAAYYGKSHSAKTIWHISHDRLVGGLSFNDFSHFPFGLLEHLTLRYSIRNADTVISQTRRQAMLLQKNYKRQVNHVLSNFHPYPEEDIQKNSHLQIVWVANFKDWKQPELFIRLAFELRQYKDVKFIMVGRPGNAQWMKEIEQQLETLSNLTWLGSLSVEQVNQILAKSHVFVNTSLYEGFPNTFIQAWMRKVPVLSLNADIDGILEKEEVGFICRSFENLVKRTKFLIENKSRRDEMGLAAQAYAFKNFSIEGNMPKILSALME